MFKLERIHSQHQSHPHWHSGWEKPSTAWCGHPSSSRCRGMRGIFQHSGRSKAVSVKGAVTSRVCPSLPCAWAAQKQNTVPIERKERYLLSMLPRVLLPIPQDGLLWETTSFFTIIVLCILHCSLDFLCLVLCTASTCNILKCMYWSLSLGAHSCSKWSWWQFCHQLQWRRCRVLHLYVIFL